MNTHPHKTSQMCVEKLFIITKKVETNQMSINLLMGKIIQYTHKAVSSSYLCLVL